MSKILELREKRNKIWNTAKEFLDQKRGADGLVPAEAAAEYDKMEDDMVALGHEIERLERQAAYDLTPKQNGIVVYRNRRISCVVEEAGFIVSIGERSPNFFISLLCPSPFFETLEEVRNELALWIPLFHFELEIPPEGIEFGLRQPSQIITVDNIGEVSCGCMIVFKALGSVTNPELLNMDNGEYVKINTTMNAGDELRIYTHFAGKRVIKITGGTETNIFSLLDIGSTFLQLAAGRNTLRYDAGTNIELLEVSLYHALADGGTSPPDPPAQEWLNQVLAALAALDENDTYALLNLTYNLLYDNYTLLGTAHDQMIGMRDAMYIRTGIILNHLHPVETASAPNMASRRASITFTGISVGNNMVLGSVTYLFAATLGSPAANTVQVLVQSNLSGTVKKLAEAIRGVQDAANIAYGSGTNPHPTCTGYWTKQRFSIGDISVAPGESLFLLEKSEDVNTALTLTSTAASTVNAFIRMPHLRYVLTGNVSGSGGVNSVRGPLHTILPIGGVVIGGQEAPLIPVPYDCHLVTICRQSDTTEKELDFYISNDEQTFTRISRSTPLGSNSSADAQHVQIAMRQSRVPAGYGLYIRIGSNGTSATAYCDLKFTYHLYPAALAVDTDLML